MDIFKRNMANQFRKYQILYASVVIIFQLKISLQKDNSTDYEYKRLERGYPSASGTWNFKNNVHSYGWDSSYPVDICSRCVQSSKGHYLPPKTNPNGQHGTQFDSNGQYGTQPHMRNSPPIYNDQYRGNGYDNFSPEWKIRQMMDSNGPNKWNNVNDNWQLISTSNQQKHNAQERNWDSKNAYPVQVEGYSQQDRSSSRGNWKPDWLRGGIVQGWIGGRTYTKSSNNYKENNYNPNQYYGSYNSDGYNRDYGHNNDYNYENKYPSEHNSHFNRKKPNKNVVYYEYNLDDKKSPTSFADPFKNCFYQCKHKISPSASHNYPPTEGANYRPESSGNYQLQTNHQSNYLSNSGSGGYLPHQNNYNRQRDDQNDYHQRHSSNARYDSMQPYSYGTLNDDEFQSSDLFNPTDLDIRQFQQPNQHLEGFKPWDETTKGVSGWDIQGKGHYFAVDDKQMESTSYYGHDHSWKLPPAENNHYPIMESSLRKWDNSPNIERKSEYLKSGSQPTEYTIDRGSEKTIRYSGHSGVGATTEHGFPVKVTNSIYPHQKTYVRSTITADETSKQSNDTQQPFFISVPYI